MKKIIFTALSIIIINFSFAQTFTANPNQICAEGANLFFNLNASGLPFSSDASYGFYEVCVTLNHPKASDVQLSLESPNGTNMRLVNNNGGANNFTTACFRLYATNSIRYINAPFSGSYMAYDNLRDFTNGQNPNGLWRLIYNDNVVNGVTGTLVSWSINFVATPHLASLQNSTTNFPIFKIDVPSGTIPDDPKVPGLLKVISNSSGINSFNATTYTFTSNLGIEVQGFTSAWNAKPNYDFELHDMTGADTSIALLGMPPESDWILKACVTDEYMCKDPLTFEMSRRMGYYAPRTRYVEMIVNGDYVGVYILTEKVKRDSNRVNIAKLAPIDTAGAELTGGYIFEVNPNGDPAAWYSNYLGYQGPNLTQNYEFKVVYPHQNILHPTQLNYIHAFVDSFEDALHGTNFQDPVNGWRRYATEKDLIDFLIVSEYSTNYDTYGRSTYLFKEKSTDGNKIHCGPPWDADRGYCCDTGWVHIITHGYWVFPFWWVRLREDSVFNKTLACRFASLRNDALSDNAFLNFIDSNELYIRHAVQRNENRWQNYVADISILKSNVVSRLAWMQSKLGGNVFAPPPLTNTTYCAGEPINIYIGNQYTYNFQPGPDTSYYAPQVAGTYKAVVSTKYGCKTVQNLTITPHPQPVITGNQYPCKNSQEVYKVTHVPGSTYVWNVYGGTPISGCGTNDSTCTVQWALPNFCMVKVKQSLTPVCSDTDIHPITIQTCNGVNDYADENFIHVYPSPVHTVLHIESVVALQQETVYDATGRIVMHAKAEKNMDVSKLPAGAYLLVLSDADKRIFKARFVKE